MFIGRNRIGELRSNASRVAVMDAMEMTAVDHYRRHLEFREFAMDKEMLHTDRQDATAQGRAEWSVGDKWRTAVNHLRRLDGRAEFDLGARVREEFAARNIPIPTGGTR